MSSQYRTIFATPADQRERERYATQASKTFATPSCEHCSYRPETKCLLKQKEVKSYNKCEQFSRS